MGAGAVAAIVTVGASSTAGAIPKREPEVWNCPGGTTMIVTAGRNGWIGDTHYQAVSFRPPARSLPPEGRRSRSPSSSSGPVARLAGAITCTMHVDDVSPDGHFVADFRVTAVAT